MDADVTGVLVVLFIATQLLYLGAYAIEGYIFSLPVDRVDMRARTEVPGRKPFIVLFYPVLHELEAETNQIIALLKSSKKQYFQNPTEY